MLGAVLLLALLTACGAVVPENEGWHKIDQSTGWKCVGNDKLIKDFSEGTISTVPNSKDCQR